MNASDTNDATVNKSEVAVHLPERWNQQRALALAKLNAPVADAPPEHQVAWIFNWSLEHAKTEIQFVNDLISQVDSSEEFSQWELASAMRDACDTLGLPCDAELHEQPHQFRRLFTPPLAGSTLREYENDPFDPDRPLEHLTPELWFLWFRKVNEIAQQMVDLDVPTKDRMSSAIHELKLIGLRLLAWTWPEGVVGRLEAHCDNCDFLMYTSGCFDSISGDLLDPETPALREFIAGGCYAK